MSIDKNIINKIKRILKVSDRIKLDRMQGILEMNDKIFNEKLLDWAEEFGFRIDGEFVNFNNDTVDDFINMLDSKFESWKSQETAGAGKVDEIKRVDVLEAKVKVKEEELIEFRVDEYAGSGKRTILIVIIAAVALLLLFLLFFPPLIL